MDFVLGTPICVLDSDINVRNLTTLDYAGEGIAVGGRSKCVNIFGTYKPNTDYVHNFTMQDGSTIDLSERTAAFDVTELSLEFAQNSKIKVRLSDRKVSSYEPVIIWKSKPENVKFVSADGEMCGIIAKDRGLYPLKSLMIILR